MYSLYKNIILQLLLEHYNTHLLALNTDAVNINHQMLWCYKYTIKCSVNKGLSPTQKIKTWWVPFTERQMKEIFVTLCFFFQSTFANNKGCEIIISSHRTWFTDYQCTVQHKVLSISTGKRMLDKSLFRQCSTIIC